MKKIYFTLFASLPLLINAQNITQADLPGVGTAFTMGNDTDFVVTIQAGGTGQVWDYSSNLQNDVTETTAFIAAAGTPYASTFPSANLANFSASDTSYAYFKSDATGFYLKGIATPSFMVAFGNGQMYIPVPFSMGDTRDNSASLQIDQVYIDSMGGMYNARVIHTIMSHFDGDASGSLTTPTSTYTSVLRIKDTELTTDTFKVDFIGTGNYTTVSSSARQVTRYRFVTSGLGANLIMQIDADSLGTLSTNANFLVNSTVNVPKINDNKFATLYPNPVNGFVNFNNVEENSEVIFYDGSGKVVLNSKVTNNMKLNLETLKNGVYHYEIIQNDKIQKGNIVIQH